jgi:rubrerythrin
MSNPVEPADAGRNRTGVATSPRNSKASVEAARAATVTPRFDLQEMAVARLAFSTAAEPVGTMPPPASIKGVAKAAVQAVQGEHPMVFLDLLGERLAFERTGTRLYDALLTKLEAAHDHQGGPTRVEVEEIRDDELRHAALLKEAIETMGADPTAVTPSADVAAVASQGLVAVLTDARTTLTEALKTVLIAELADNDAWSMLSDLASRLGQDELARQFQGALQEEQQHLARVRTWVTASVDRMAGVQPQTGGASRPPDGGSTRARRP